MKLQFTGLVREKYTSDKGVEYVSFVDMQTGGDIKLSFPAATELQSGQVVKAEVEAQGRFDKAGGVYLGFRAGSFAK